MTNVSVKPREKTQIMIREKTPTFSKLTTSQDDEHHRAALFKDWLRKKFIEFNETCLVCFQKVKPSQWAALRSLKPSCKAGSIA